MPSPISFTKFDLKVPLFDAEFDPYNRGFLVVGGGGGESHTGVANTLALLDTSSRSEITLSAQLDLSRDEDSVQSLANLTTPNGLVTLAGINSSSIQHQKGENDHFRSFMVDFPQRRHNDAKASQKQTSKGKIAFSGKCSLFKASPRSKAWPYQRILRLSPVTSREVGNKRLGAVATGDAAKNEIVLFNAVTATAANPVICARIEPADGKEAVDLDLYETEENSYALAYCTNHSIFTYNLNYDFVDKKIGKTSGKPTEVYSVSSAPKPGGKPNVRCLRWLSSRHILLLQKAHQVGAELLVLDLKIENERGRVVARKIMPKSLKVAAHLDVCVLDPDAATGERQIIIAVAGQDSTLQSTIHVLTLNFRPNETSSEQMVGKFANYTVINQVHTSNIMKITWSNFFVPRQPPNSTMSIASTTQYIQLASVAWGGTVVIDTFALTSTPTSPSETSTAATKKPRGTPSVRWVLSENSLTERLMSWSGLIIIAMMILLGSVLLQSYLSLTSTTSNSTVQAIRNLQPPGAIAPAMRSASALASEARNRVASGHSQVAEEQDGAIGANVNGNPDYSKLSSAVAAAKPVGSQAIPSSVSQVAHHLGDLLQLRHRPASQTSITNNSGEERHILVEHDSEGAAVSASLHSDTESLRRRGAKKFEELSTYEKELWKKRLRETGHWGENLPETVLKGVFFSQWAAVVGGGLRDAILNH